MNRFLHTDDAAGDTNRPLAQVECNSSFVDVMLVKQITETIAKDNTYEIIIDKVYTICKWIGFCPIAIEVVEPGEYRCADDDKSQSYIAFRCTISFKVLGLRYLE